MADRHPGLDDVWREVYVELGILVVRAGGLEETIRNALLLMLPGRNWRRTQLVIDGFSSAQMRERCVRLAWEILEGDLRDDVLGWLTEAADAQAERNAIIHSHWSGGLSTHAGVEHGAFAIRQRVAKARRGMETATVAHTAETVALVSSKCWDAELRGTNLVVEMQEHWLAEQRDGRDPSIKWSRPRVTDT